MTRAAEVVLLAPLALAAVGLQAVCGGLFEWGGARPDLVLAVVVGVGLMAGWRQGAFTGAVAGWAVVALTPQHPWMWLPCYAAAGGLAGIMSHPFYRESVWCHALLVLLGGVLLGAAVWLPALGTWQMWKWWWGSSVYSALMAPLVFLGLRRVWAGLW